MLLNSIIVEMNVNVILIAETN